MDGSDRHTELRGDRAYRQALRVEHGDETAVEDLLWASALLALP